MLLCVCTAPTEVIFFLLGDCGAAVLCCGAPWHPGTQTLLAAPPPPNPPPALFWPLQVAVKASQVLPEGLGSACLQALLLPSGAVRLSPTAAASSLEALLKLARSQGQHEAWAQQLHQAEGLNPLAGLVSAALVLPAARAQLLRRSCQALGSLACSDEADAAEQLQLCALAVPGLKLLHKSAARALEGGEQLPADVSAAAAEALLLMPAVLQALEAAGGPMVRGPLNPGKHGRGAAALCSRCRSLPCVVQFSCRHGRQAPTLLMLSRFHAGTLL